MKYVLIILFFLCSCRSTDQFDYLGEHPHYAEAPARPPNITPPNNAPDFIPPSPPDFIPLPPIGIPYYINNSMWLKNNKKGVDFVE